MQARRVVIVLALTALSVVTLFLITLMEGTALGAESRLSIGAVPDTLDYYRESVSIGPEGDALVEVSVVLAGGGAGDLLLPFAFTDGHDFTILSGPIRFAEESGGVEAPTRQVLGSLMLSLRVLETAAAGDTAVVGAVVPGWFDRDASREEYGEFAVERSFVNTSAFVFRDFELAVELPDGMLVHSVTKTVPSYDPKKSPNPPYAVGRGGDRGWAQLRQQNFVPATTVEMRLRIRAARRGLIPLVVGLVLAVCYLVFYRDVLKPGEGD